MPVTTITIPMDADYKAKPWVARILGRDPKMTYKREFVPQHVTKPGVYEATARKNKRNVYLVARYQGDLVRINIGDETLALILDHPEGVNVCAKITPTKYQGDWTVRRDGALLTDASPLHWEARNDAIATIKRLMAEHNITPEDL